MSSCFLCDCSHMFTSSDLFGVYVKEGSTVYNDQKYIKELPIMIGSSGTYLNDQQHNNNERRNYVSYRVKKIEFRCSVGAGSTNVSNIGIPDYVLVFKIPFRTPIFDYLFADLNKFMLYSEPESVLGYKTLSIGYYRSSFDPDLQPSGMVKIDINKPFIVGPNDYVGVIYMFEPARLGKKNVDASARVWFDVV